MDRHPASSFSIREFQVLLASNAPPFDHGEALAWQQRVQPRPALRRQAGSRRLCLHDHRAGATHDVLGMHDLPPFMLLGSIATIHYSFMLLCPSTDLFAFPPKSLTMHCSKKERAAD